MDSVNVCQFVYGPAWQLYGTDQLVELIRAVTGWDVDVQEVLQVGERRLNMMRLFNAREGIGRSEDKLPKKMFDRPLEGGRSDGYHIDRSEWDQALDDYYRLNDWGSGNGISESGKAGKSGIVLGGEREFRTFRGAGLSQLE